MTSPMMSQTTLSTAPTTGVPHPRRMLLLGAGYLSFATGFAGMFLPVLPTTVFWIIAAVCFAKSSPAMYQRILAWPRVGPVIGSFVERGVIGKRSRNIALAGMAATGGLILLAAVGGALGPGPAGIAFAGLFTAAIYVTTRPSD